MSHYWHNNSEVNGAWHFGGSFATNVTGAPSLIQSTFGKSASGHGNFEAVVQQGTRLVHWYKDNATVINSWIQAKDIVSDGVGGGARW